MYIRGLHREEVWGDILSFLIMTPLSLIAAVCFWITVAQSW